MTDKKAQPLSVLMHAHYGRPAMILGGGVSLPEQAARAPEGCVFISANQHGCILRECDYIVCCDVWEHRTFKMPDGTLRPITYFGVPIISTRRGDADYRVFEQPAASAGVTGAWAAWVMGCAPILLAGMNCYVGGTYFHDRKAQSSGQHVPVDQHLRRWAKLQPAAPDGMFRSLGGPLAELFLPYDPAEPVTLPAKRDRIHGTYGIQAKVKHAWRLPPHAFGAGELIELAEGEVRRGLREKAIERVSA